MFFCNENQLDALFTCTYFVKQPLHVSVMFIAHHQEVFTVYILQLVRVIRLGLLACWPGQVGTPC
jgi:hypothetical protein